MHVELALRSDDELGEGPCWDARSGELLRVDIARGLVLRWSPVSGAAAVFETGGEVGAAPPRAAGGHVLAVDRELRLQDADGSVRVLAAVEGELTANRFNDCQCDPQGRLWAGTMSKRSVRGDANLYRLEAGGELTVAIAGVTISNGIGWSPDSTRMYYVDSSTQRIDALDFDAATGTLGERRPLVAIDPADGMPDGLVVDAEGGIWVGLWDGGAIRRYSDTGALDAHVELPAAQVTSAAFGGEDLRTLYVTTARVGCSAAQLAAKPLTGSVLALEPGVAGLPANRFAG